MVCCVGVSTGPARAGDDGAQFLLFSGADLWRDGRFMHGGLLWSPGGLDREGFTLQAHRFGRAVPLPLRRAQQCLGDRRRGGGAVAAGLAVQARPARAQGFRRARHQERRHQSLRSVQPIARAHPSASAPPSICGSNRRPQPWSPPTRRCPRSPPAIRRAPPIGWRLHDWFYLGPEAQTFACVGYSQLRFGIHLTGLKTEQWEWSAAAGWSGDSDHRSSPYLRLGVLTRR